MFTLLTSHTGRNAFVVITVSSPVARDATTQVDIKGEKLRHTNVRPDGEAMTGRDRETEIGTGGIMVKETKVATKKIDDRMRERGCERENTIVINAKPSTKRKMNI